MSGKDRINIFPSRANKVLIKTRTLSANKGLQLLKKKRDALELKLRDIEEIRKANAANRNEQCKDAIFSIAKAHFLLADFRPAPILGSKSADAFMRMTFVKTIGLTLPTFEPVIQKSGSLPLTGLARGGIQVELVRERFQELFKIIVLLASCDYSIRILKDAIRVTNMRVNGLEYVIIPRLLNTMLYITNELDEMEREEFYRIKRSQAKRQRAKEKTKAKQDEDEGAAVACFGPTCADKTTSIDIYVLDDTPIQIFRKSNASAKVQTVITGRTPEADEIISPTASVVSSTLQTNKRSSYIETTFKPVVNRNSNPTALPPILEKFDSPIFQSTYEMPQTSKAPTPTPHTLAYVHSESSHDEKILHASEKFFNKPNAEDAAEMKILPPVLHETPKGAPSTPKKPTADVEELKIEPPALEEKPQGTSTPEKQADVEELKIEPPALEEKPQGTSTPEKQADVEEPKIEPPGLEETPERPSEDLEIDPELLNQPSVPEIDIESIESDDVKSLLEEIENSSTTDTEEGKKKAK